MKNFIKRKIGETTTAVKESISTKIDDTKSAIKEKVDNTKTIVKETIDDKTRPFRFAFHILVGIIMLVAGLFMILFPKNVELTFFISMISKGLLMLLLMIIKDRWLNLVAGLLCVAIGVIVLLQFNFVDTEILLAIWAFTIGLYKITKAILIFINAKRKTRKAIVPLVSGTLMIFVGIALLTWAFVDRSVFPSYTGIVTGISFILSCLVAFYSAFTLRRPKRAKT